MGAAAAKAAPNAALAMIVKNLARSLPGRAGADIDALGFLFMQPVEEAVLEDLAYSGIPLVGASPQVCKPFRPWIISHVSVMGSC